MKRIILCADDYGQNPVISQAIIDLFEKKCLSATSALTNFHDWEIFSKRLHPFKNKVDIGLHLNLTEGKPLSSGFKSIEFFSLPKLLLFSYAGILDKGLIYKEFEAQLDRFIDCVGQLPDFIDGHQHIHQFPIVRDAVILLWKNRLQQQGVYMRCTYQAKSYLHWHRSAFLKFMTIQLCGAKALKEQIIKYAIPHNGSFDGVYDFAQAANYPQFFWGFMQNIQDDGLIMCHPGMEPGNDKDDIAMARFHEYRYFTSDQFLSDCRSQNIELTRFKRLS